MYLFRCLFVIIFFQSLSLFALSEEPRLQADAVINYKTLLAKAGFSEDEIREEISGIQGEEEREGELVKIQDLLRTWSAAHDMSLNPSVTRNLTLLRYARNAGIILGLGVLGFTGGVFGTIFLCEIPALLSLFPEAIFGPKALSHLLEAGFTSFSATEFFVSCIESTRQLPIFITLCSCGFGCFIAYKYGNEVVVEKVGIEEIISTLKQTRGDLSETTERNLRLIYRYLFPDAHDNQINNQRPAMFDI